MQIRLQMELPGGPSRVLEVSGDPIRLGRSPDCEVTADATIFPKVSSLHARIESSDLGHVLVPLSRSNKTLLNDDPIDDRTPIQVGDRIRLGFTGPTFAILAIESSLPLAEGFDETVQADVRSLLLLRGSSRVERLYIGIGGVIGREAGAVQYLLDHPHVSRLHANIALDLDRVILADLGSANGTFVNGQKLTRPVGLKLGDRIDIGPFSLLFEGDRLVGQSRSNNIELVARDLRRIVRGRDSGESLCLLEDINLVIKPREFVGVLGPSGSGKSTLLAILSGRNPPDSGKVSVNGEDLYADFEAIKGDIAVVPQREILHDTLTVGQALRFTAELRLPPDTSGSEVNASISDVLEIVGLANRRSTPIRHLSGGQVKRASLANELISRPSLLFLDEVTSGLDEQSDREVMEVFRQVANSGKTVVCITHNLANVEATCHLVVILTEGGRLAFYGSPEEAKAYFGVLRLGDIFRKLAERTTQEWHDLFRTSSFFRRYVTERMPSGSSQVNENAKPSTRRGRGGAGNIRQAVVLTRRYISIWRSEPVALLAILGQSVLIAVLLGLVFGRLPDVADLATRVPLTMNLLLLLGVSCFWFGCNTAAKELVKERIIFQRERDFNLRVGSYFASKVFVLGPISVAQTSLLFLIVRSWCEPPGSIGLQWLMLTALALAGTMVGLLISALARSQEVATALVPIAIMPQIILNGVIAPLSGLAGWLAKGLVIVYWGQKGLESLLPDSERFPFLRESEVWWLPFALIITQAAVLGAATILGLWSRNAPANR